MEMLSSFRILLSANTGCTKSTDCSLAFQQELIPQKLHSGVTWISGEADGFFPL